MRNIAELKRISRLIRDAALAAADPAAAVKSALVQAGERAGLLGKDFPPRGRLVLVAVGKASPSMAAAALSALGESIAEGIVVMPRGYTCDLGGHPGGRRVAVFAAGHPVPDQDGMGAARRVRDLLASLDEKDACLLLLSGGGSSLLPMPYPPVTLAEKGETTLLLLKSGADIRQINTVRKHISAIKGGRLAEKIRGRIVSLVLSDVVGDPLDFIASGPAVPDPTTFADARGVLARYQLLDRIPGTVRQLIEDGCAGMIPETPKTLPSRHVTRIVASNRIAVDAAAAEAARNGFTPLILTTFLTGEAREAGRFMAAIAKESRVSGTPSPPPACILAGGETTVTVTGNGLGGRNQEMVLAAAIELAGEKGMLFTAFATDGKEGNTDAAGATASGETLAAGARAGRDPHACLRANDSYAFLAAAGELIVTGPTYTNVNDIVFALVDRTIDASC